ncbi:hypothetical protein ATCV1_z774R [Acanthocystis turfacea chlorella virus 1]|uniref:Uncharacterized protein z774R n=1 Tax=Chlorovirus heliozoae TaxID=322019 RepID=A7KA34_9PHYC|nr:hypothetical protein ATCV1_z774R [Acanthocystis turfacea chlorella virus 1]ABT16908.1 hypothetical protein ATCV1_z774R [Acanthocystis turfacea chlorella virus 1]
MPKSNPIFVSSSFINFLRPSLFRVLTSIQNNAFLLSEYDAMRTLSFTFISLSRGPSTITYPSLSLYPLS